MKKIYLLLLSSLVFSLFAVGQATTYNPSLFIKTDINVGNPAYPFPQFLEYKGGGKSLAKYNAEGVTHADMEKTMREAYEIMMHRCRYMGGTHCGVPYITFNHGSVPGNYGTFVSEGDGYALLAAVIFADQKTFNGLYMWIHDNRMSGVKRFQDGRVLRAELNDYAGPYLAGWQNDETTTSMSPSHSATDGDVDIAMAMLIAYKQWGEWMVQDGTVVKDYAGNPISLKYEAQRVIGALVDTCGQIDPGNGQVSGCISGDIGIDGYCKKGNSWGELTRWRFSAAGQAAYPGMNGPYGSGPNLLSQYGTLWIDYDAPSYFDEFYRWLKNGDGVDENNKDVADWEISQFKRAAASGNWLNKQAYNQGYYASIGNVTVGDLGENPQFNVYVDGEDFRYAWRHLMDYLWHGDSQYDWDPVTHQVIEGQVNNSERLMGIRHAQLLENPSSSGEQICSKMGASPDPGQPLWFGVSQIPQQWRFDGGITSVYHTNYSVGAGAPAAVISENHSLLSDIYRQCEIMWDGNNTAAKLDPEERYIGSTPKYFHGWFRTLGMLVCSGNLAAPEDMKPIANMKVYMSVDKTYAYEGDKVDYTVQYRNYGSLDAKDVKIQTPLDPDYTFVSATKGGKYDAATHTITWNIGTVPGFKTGGLAATQDSVAFTVRITSLENARVCETSTITGSNFDEWVSNEYPNHATYTMERNCVDVLANRSLVLEKNANRTELNPHDVVTFTVNFENVSSEDAWLNGGRDNVRLSYGNYYMQGNAYQFYHLYRFWNDSYEAYINMNNYRLSYFMYDAAAQGLYNAASNPTGWTFVVDNQNDLDKYGYNPETGPITFAYQKIPQGEDEYGKWNQRLMIRFADVLMAPSTHVYDKLDSQYLLHKGVWGPGFIRARLASNPNSDLSTRVQDDWSFSTDITAKTIDGQGETFTLVTPCWANYDNLGYEIDNYSRHTCSSPTSKLKNFERVLVEEFDGYTWRRIQGRGPLPGKEAYNVTIVDTIPLELEWKEFVTKKALGIEATYTPAPAGANYTGIVKWTIPEMLVGESGKFVYTCVAKDLGCPEVGDTYYINAAWIYSDTDSPDSSAVSLMTTCTELPPYIEPQNSLFKTASSETASVGDVITYEVKYVNTMGSVVDEDCSSSTNWMGLGNKAMPSPSNGKFTLNTSGSGAYFFGPKNAYGENGSMYVTFSGCNSTTQELYYVMRYVSGTPGAADFKGIAIKLFINKDGAHNFGYELYNNGTLVKKEGSSWADAIQFSGSSSNPVFKFVLNDDHLYMYVNDEENEWTSVLRDWKGLSSGAGYCGVYVNSNGNGQTALDAFHSELDYAFDIAISDELPDELTSIENISGSGTYSAGAKKITWPVVPGPLAPNEEISYTFDATVYECNSYINNYAVASVSGQEDLRVVNSVKCGATVCPDAPVTKDITICKGTTPANLTAVGTNLKWYTTATGGVGTATLKPTTDEAGVTTYYVSQTSNGCESVRAELVVTVVETEKPIVAETVSLCKGGDVSALTATGTDLIWYNDSKVALAEAPTPDNSVEGSVTYYVTQTVDECESDFAEITVTVGALEKPVVEAVDLCQDEVASALSAMATGTLQWYESATATVALAAAPIPASTTVGESYYYVSQKSGECESERAKLTVTVKPKPTADIASSASSYCGETSTIKLSLTSDIDLDDATYSWVKDGEDIAETATILNALQGEYVCTIDLNGCSATTAALEITQHENPAYTITGGGSYCPESLTKDLVVITFTAGEAPFTFTDAVIGEKTSETESYTIENPQGGVYQLTTLTDANNCEMTGTGATVEVVDLETPDISIATIPGICPGDGTIDVSAYVTAENGTLTYKTDKGTISATGVLSDLTTSGTYTVSVTLAGTVAPYCSNTKTTEITVFELPTVVLPAKFEACSGVEMEITPTVTPTDATYTYSWTESEVGLLNSLSAGTVTAQSSVTDKTDFDVTLVVTDKTTKCSSSQAQTVVTVNPIPVATIAMDKKEFCKSDTEAKTISATVKPAGLNGSFDWTNVDAVSATVASAKFVPNENAAGDYEISYTFTSEANCKSEPASLTVTVFDIPTISITPNYSDVCESGVNSSDISVKASKTNGTFNYSVNNGGVISTDGIMKVADNAVGTYTVTLDYTDENECSAVATTDVTIHALPTVTFDATNVTSACYNSSEVVLQVSPAPTTAKAYSFVGTKDATSSVFAPKTAAEGVNTIQYSYTDEFGCQNSADYEITVVKVLAPTVDAPNPKTVTIDDGGVLLDVTTMTATANVATDVLVWQTETGSKLTEGSSYTSPETIEGEYSYFVKEYRMISGSACYSDSVLATLVLSNCTAKSPIVENQKLCVGDNGTVTLSASFAGVATDKKLSWFEDKALTQLLQDDTDSYSTIVQTTSEGVFTYYVAEYDNNKDCWSVPTTVTVTINPLPEIAINEIGYLCYDGGNKTATGLINSVASTAGTWSVVDDKITVDAQSGSINPTSAGKVDGTYTIRYSYTDNNGCTNMAEKDFSVEYVEVPTSKGYLGIVSKPEEVEVTVETSSLETGYSNVKWYSALASASESATGLSWKTGDDPAVEHVATYYLSQVVNGCESEKGEALVQIVNCPFAKPEVVSAVACQNDVSLDDLQASLPVSTTVAADKWIWYDANKVELSSGTANTFASGVSTSLASTTTFYVGYLATEPTTQEQCPSPLTEVTVTVNPLPEVSFVASKELVCYDEGDVVWKTSANGGVWTVDGVEQNGMSAAGVFNPTAYGQSTSTHTVSYTYTDTRTSCVATIEKDVTVQYTPAPIVKGHSALVEDNLPVVVTATADAGAQVTWYNELGAVVSKANPYTTDDNPSVVTNKSYFATQTINTCESEQAEAKVSIILCPVPKPIVVQPSTICNYDDVPELSASLGEWASRPTTVMPEVFNFYDVEVGGTPISASPSGTFTPTIDVTKSATYTYWVAEYNGNITPSACEGKRAKITLTVKKTELPSISVADETVCQNMKNPTFTAVGKGSVQWYESEPTSPDMFADASGNRFVPSFDEVGKHTVWAAQEIDGCLSEAVSAEFEIIAIPTAPSVVDASICYGDENKSVCVEDNVGQVTWYSNADKSGKLSATTCYKPMVEYAGVYNFYATQTVSGCESEVTQATYTITSLPSVPIVQTEKTSCDYDDVHVLTVKEQAGVEVSWYSSSELSSLLAVGNTYTHTIQGSGKQTYYVRQTANGCTGTYVTASFTVVERPEMPTVTNDMVCVGELATVATNGPRDYWYSDEGLTMLEGQGSSFSVPDVAGNTILYVVREKNGCHSVPAQAKISVIAIPTVSITVDDEDVSLVKRCIYEDEKTLVASVSPEANAGSYVSWYIFPGNVTVQSDSLLLSDYVSVSSGNTSNVNYTVRAQYMVKNPTKDAYCASVMDTVKVSTSAKARKPIVLSKIICQGEEIEPLTALGSKNITWMSMSGIEPPIATGRRYIFSKNQTLEVGDYSFLVFDMDTTTGCNSDSVSVTMTVAPAAKTKIFGSDSVCVDNTESYYTQFSANSTYSWFVTGDNVNYSKDALSQSVQYVDWNKPGIDTLVVYEQTWAGCQGFDTLIVKIADKPRARFVWSLPGSSNVIEMIDSTVQDSLYSVNELGEPYATEIPYTLHWNFGHIGSSNDYDLDVPYEKRHKPIIEGDYVYGYNCPVLTVENSFGCEDSYTECVFINITSGLYMPTAFAPTNPAHSVRYFQPKGYNLKTCQVSVFDKWGNLVWYSDAVEDGMFVGKWDGTCNGKMMASDVYIWKMEATFIDGQIWEGFDVGGGKKSKFGNVTLLR
ncbi:MAG: glycosyl hydrolase family 8 [Bacteroidales bacterium]|nr:glycosyl hydrolase family 8 [Bacteroidales bacterium]